MFQIDLKKASGRVRYYVASSALSFKVGFEIFIFQNETDGLQYRLNSFNHVSYPIHLSDEVVGSGWCCLHCIGTVVLSEKGGDFENNLNVQATEDRRTRTTKLRFGASVWSASEIALQTSVQWSVRCRCELGPTCLSYWAKPNHEKTWSVRPCQDRQRLIKINQTGGS